MAQIRLRGSYINLDSAAERRAGMEANLARQGLDKTVRRFSALPGDDRPAGISRGELGCLLSHQAIVEGAEEGVYSLILEDDVLFPDRFRAYFETMLRQAIGAEWDILFLCQALNISTVLPFYILLDQKRKLGDIYAPDFDTFITVDSRQFYSCTTAAYMVSPKGREKVAAVLRDTAAAGYPHPVDILYKLAIGDKRISAKFVFPYILGVDSRHQTHMAERSSNKAGDAVFDCINLFVAGIDISELRREARAMLEDADFDSDAFVASQIIYRQLKKESAR